MKPLLEECGYTGARLKENYHFDSTTVPLAGFAGEPWDFDSACVAVTLGSDESDQAVRACWGMGAPVVWVRRNGTVDWWIQRPAGPTMFASASIEAFPALVRRHKEALSPDRVYRGKTVARVDPTQQLDFVDAGFLPLLREQAGNKLHQLVEGMTHDVLVGLGVKEPGRQQIRTIFTAVLRLLAGKILKDKHVPGLGTVDLREPLEVLQAVESHYRVGKSAVRTSRAWTTALRSAAERLSGAGSFAAVSPETLAYVYEHTLVTKALRKELGIHATPPWLVDYMIWRLADWIREIPEADRHVFEPGCGHAPFLVAAMRLLRMERQAEGGTRLHSYLKSHLHGVEVDEFAREIARLSLTLADIPNPNGWRIHDEDMYATGVLEREAQRCGVLLSNPPYERFKDEEREAYLRAGREVASSKAVELMARTLPQLRQGAVFALLLPQGVLHSKAAREVRALLVDSFELREICLFADKVFEQADSESVVLMGRRSGSATKERRSIRYIRVREEGVQTFASTFHPDLELQVSLDQLAQAADTSFRIPDLPDVWRRLDQHPKLSSVADVGQGFSFAEKGLIEKARHHGSRKTQDSVPALLTGVGGVSIWELPKSSWLSPSRTPILTWRSGGFAGEAQVLVNYSPAMRGPWRIKALIDERGHAVTNSFTTIRPGTGGPSCLFIWAILNSPLANAYVYCNALKRHIYDSLLAALPLPHDWRAHSGVVEEAARAYLELVKEPEVFELRSEVDSRVLNALLSMDAAVLRAYELPLGLERAILDLFHIPAKNQDDWRRKGVGCVFGDYFPPEFNSLVPLYKYISAGYQSSTVDQVADRLRPGESQELLSGLRAAAAAFGED